MMSYKFLAAALIRDLCFYIGNRVQEYGLQVKGAICNDRFYMVEIEISNPKNGRRFVRKFSSMYTYYELDTIASIAIYELVNKP